jgi:hypothetical protein
MSPRAHLILVVLALTLCSAEAAEWRKIDGAIYRLGEGDGWHYFGRAEVIQVIRSNAFLFSLPNENKIFMVTNYPSTARLIDRQEVGFWARETGIFEYETVLGARSRIIKFDCGCEPTAQEKDAAQSKLERQEEEARKEARMKEEKEHERLRAIRDREAAEKSKRDQALKEKVIAFQREQATKGFPSFQYELGLRYLIGDGVEKNEVAAKGWLKLAAAQGHKQAAEKLKELSR